jgi:hypothetical protein
MNVLNSIFRKYYIYELIVIFSFLFSLNNITGKTDEIIVADGIGYYDYLPSIFIHRDINRKGNLKSSPVNERINALDIYIDYKGQLLNKYSCGTAILELPFFYFNKTFNTKGNESGYEKSYQKSVFYAAVFYLFLTLIFIRKLFILYNIRASVIFLSQLLLVLGTNTFFYAHFNASFSHIYSLFLISLFLFLAKQYFTTYKPFFFYLIFLVLGLIFLVRQINIIIVFSLPFISGSWSNFINGLKQLFLSKKKFIIGTILFIAVISIQSLLWYLQVGEFIVYSYNNEGFDFLNPHLLDILFSYKKGLFVYTPMLLIPFILSFLLLYKRQYFLFFSFYFFFILLTYLLSSWWSWFYGCSFGLRAFIDFYPLFFLIFVISIKYLDKKIQVIIFFTQFSLIPINLIQTIQYNKYILHWINMDKESYWNIFLKTDKRFEGMLWNERFDFSSYRMLGNSFIINNDSTIHLQKDLYNTEDAYLNLSLYNYFNSDNNSKVLLEILDNNSVVVFKDERYMLVFGRDSLNKYHKGDFTYHLPNIDLNKNKECKIKVSLISDFSSEKINYIQLKQFVY